jgi:hypothetical protein
MQSAYLRNKKFQISPAFSYAFVCRVHTSKLKISDPAEAAEGGGAMLQRVTFQLQAHLQDKVAALAKQEGRSISSMLRWLVMEALVTRGVIDRREAEDATR